MRNIFSQIIIALGKSSEPPTHILSLFIFHKLILFLACTSFESMLYPQSGKRCDGKQQGTLQGSEGRIYYTLKGLH